MQNETPAKTPAGTQMAATDIDIAWQADAGTCTLHGLPVALMWVDSTLAGLMAGLNAMVGTQRFVLALQSEGRNSVAADWAVIAAHPNFQDGFQAIAKIGREAGWGHWVIHALDQHEQHCRVRAYNTWEGRYQKALGVCWGSAMLAGKLAGYCSRLFGVNCWAEQTRFIARGDDWDEFDIRPSPRTVEAEIDHLLAADAATRADMAVALQKLRASEHKHRQLFQDLREREEIFSAIVNQAAEGIVLLDANTLAIVEFNEAACAALGYTREEFATLALLDIQVSPEEMRARAEQINDSGQADFETRHRHKDGRIRLVDVKNRLLKVRGGRYWAAVWRDITDARTAEQALREEAERRRLMFAHSRDGIAVLDFNGRLLEWNRRFAEMLGYTDQDMARLHVWDWDAQWSRAQLLAMMTEVPVDGNTAETLHRRRDGSLYHVEISSSRVEWGGQAYLFSTHRDISERKQAEQALEDSRQFLQSVFDAIQDGISVIDADFRVLRANAWLEQRYPAQAPLAGRQCYHAFQCRDTVCSWCPAKSTFTSGAPSTAVVPYPHADAPEGWLELSTYPLKDGDGRVIQVIGYAKDITLQRSYQQKLEHIAHYDPLTDLPNRTLLAERLEQAMARARRQQRPLALGYLDLDGFKDINDQHGHDVGDALLVVMADRVSQALRETDMAARLGGDEFVVILADFPGGRAGEDLLGGILAAVARPIHASDLVLQLSASLGVTLYPQADAADADADADQLLRQADQAMYQAKLQGKNRYHLFDTEADRRQRGRHESLQRLRQALDDEEFTLYYQPKVNMRTGAVIGAEALVRWQHPERGLLPPAAFLPVIENQPLGLKLEYWIFARALAQMDRWRAQGLTLPVSINVSAYQLQQPGFMEQLGALLRAHPRLDPAQVELEVLETSALEDLKRVSRIMRDCTRLGVRFALDDFGTGYSSLTYLKHLPAAVLKIDQSFVRDMLEDADDLAILEGIQGMARAFRRQVVAEGVETYEHGELLLALGCELAQGYVIARPMPAEEIPAWVAAWRSPASWSQAPPPLMRADLPLLYAGVEHRGWVLAIEAYLHGKQDAPPPLEIDACRFGAWLRQEAHLHPSASSCMTEIDHLHAEVHRLGKALIERQAEGAASEREARLTDLKARRDVLLAKLKSLMQGCALDAEHQRHRAD
jgi:diguanylate cyclase (GGDEF)-like protein/PAS domain S-box-containing protein